MDAAFAIYEQQLQMNVFVVNKDVDGHIYNRLFSALIKEAGELVDSGACTATTVDQVTQEMGRALTVGIVRNMIVVGGPNVGAHAIEGIAVSRLLTVGVASGSNFMARIFGDSWFTIKWIQFLQSLYSPMKTILNRIVKFKLRKIMEHCDLVLAEQPSWDHFMNEVMKEEYALQHGNDTHIP
eukprot:gene11569-13668_t